MNSKSFRLTPGLREQIVSSVRAGGYPHVAAEAWGVPKDLLDDWLKRGANEVAREPYRSFARDVRQAFAQARLRAEIEVYKDEPKVWLIHGPGRETDELPGWSVSVKPAEPTAITRNVLCDPELMAFLTTLMKALAPFPEAREHVAQALVELGDSASPASKALQNSTQEFQ